MLEFVVFVSLLLWILYKCCMNTAAATYNTLSSIYGGSFEAIADKFNSLEEVNAAVRKCGLESSNIIFGVDFTLSNLSQGEKSFDGKSLHHLDSHQQNPYQQVIQILGETLENFDEDNIIPAYGFGDLGTKDHSVFSLSQQGYCLGFHGVLEAYQAVVPNIKLSGPTNFAPLIYKAIDIVKQTRAYHILVIVADGQVTSERATTEAIVAASHFPLSIIMVGVGDGPWNSMKCYDDKLPQRKFDNFQFVDFHNIMYSKSSYKNPQAAFALQALMEIPDQYKAIKALGYLG